MVHNQLEKIHKEMDKLVMGFCFVCCGLPALLEGPLKFLLSHCLYGCMDVLMDGCMDGWM